MRYSNGPEYIQYDYHRRRAVQVIDDNLDFEGDLGEIIQKLQELKTDLEKENSGEGFTLHDKYIDLDRNAPFETTKKVVKFDRIFIEQLRSYSDSLEHQEHVVKGERDLLPEEAAAIDREEAEAAEQRRAANLKEYERLKELLGEK